MEYWYKVKKSLEKAGDLCLTYHYSKVISRSIDRVDLVLIGDLVCRSSPCFYFFIFEAQFDTAQLDTAPVFLVMFDDFLNAAFVLEYFLVVAAALVCSSCFHQKRHLQKHFLRLSRKFGAHFVLIIGKELNISFLLIFGPFSLSLLFSRRIYPLFFLMVDDGCNWLLIA